MLPLVTALSCTSLMTGVVWVWQDNEEVKAMVDSGILRVVSVHGGTSTRVGA